LEFDFCDAEGFEFGVGCPGGFHPSADGFANVCDLVGEIGCRIFRVFGKAVFI
jgi:hypothetical protein